jgi:hypothetical protein
MGNGELKNGRPSQLFASQAIRRTERGRQSQATDIAASLLREFRRFPVSAD